MSPAVSHNLVLFGLLAVALGGAVYRFASPLARFSEQLDAIGSTTSAEEVEPASWKVVLYRAVGVLTTIAGVVFVARGLFVYL